MSTNLERLPLLQHATVCEIVGGAGLRRNLRRMGIHIGDVLRVVGSGALGGPLLVEIHGSRIALGRGVARRVVVCPFGECVAETPLDKRGWLWGRHGRRRPR